jgi:type IV pilus assembly protein PilA
MIVVAIVGLLSAMALPQFLNSRDWADVKAKVGYLVAISKECFTFIAEADITSSTLAGPINTVTCGGSSPASVTISSRSWRVSLAV